MPHLINERNGKISGFPTSDVEEFVGCLFKMSDNVIVRLIESWSEDGKTQCKIHETSYLHADEIADADWRRAWIKSGASLNANHFFGVCPRAGRRGFDLAGQIRTVRVLWSDIDHCLPHEAVERCELAHLPRPSIVVRSGNGVHLYWLLEKALVFEDLPYSGAVRRGKSESGRSRYFNEEGADVLPPKLLGPAALKVQSVIQGIGEKIGGDSTHDLARLLRLPGTPNRKNARNGAEPVPCEIVEMDSTRRFAFSAFEGFAKPMPTKVSRPRIEKVNGHPTQVGTKLVSMTPFQQTAFQNLIQECREAEDRSKADFALCSWASRQGMDPDGIWPLVEDCGKFEERGWGYFDRTWQKASEKVTDDEDSQVRTAMMTVEADLARLDAKDEAVKGAEPNQRIISAAAPRKTAKSFLATVYPNGTLKFECPDVWRVWNGRVYEEIQEQHLRAKVSGFLDDCFTHDRQGKLVPFATTPQKELAVIQEIKNLRTLPTGVRAPTWFGGDGPDPQSIVSFQNGHLDVQKFITGERSLISHTPTWYALHCLPHSFDPDARCPQWLKFLDEVYEGDQERIRFLQQWCGYCLTPDTSLERLVILFGQPRSGKGTITTVLNDVLGQYNVASPRLKKLGTEFGLWSLVGKLVAIVPDAHLPKSDNSDVLEVLKLISGNDTVDIERKHKQSIDNVKLTTRIVISTNELPSFNDNSAALADRAVILPHQVSFKGKVDPGLKARLREEVIGVTNWALEGLVSLRKEGLHIPRISKDADEAWRATLSPISEFVEKCCVIDPSSDIPIAHLYLVYKDWCEAERHHPVAKTNLLVRLQTVAPKITQSRPRQQDGERPKCYKGIGLNHFGKQRLAQFTGTGLVP